jgi:hypothetical protein
MWKWLKYGSTYGLELILCILVGALAIHMYYRNRTGTHSSPYHMLVNNRPVQRAMLALASAREFARAHDTVWAPATRGGGSIRGGAIRGRGRVGGMDGGGGRVGGTDGGGDGGNESSRVQSKQEREVRGLLEALFGRKFVSTRPLFLRNDVTGHNLELDCYCEELKLGVEVNGIQHYKYSPYFHRNHDQFRTQQYRDAMKHTKCAENGVVLVDIPYTAGTGEKLEAYLLQQLSDAGL